MATGSWASRAIKSPSNYEEAAAQNFVVLSADRAPHQDRNGIAGSRAFKQDDPLCSQTLVYLTEYPRRSAATSIRSSSTAREILITVMRHHQRYFSVHDAVGTWRRIRRRDEHERGSGRPQGNERVLRARFNDARFFWDVDQQKSSPIALTTSRMSRSRRSSARISRRPSA